ncbi:hypothetical protein WJX72_000134 [[Myrmecia] bisecta]|uniref:DNA replication complex GINS protein SLD5 n=1 Tax=[Myrmecia] bisecta TaxID=41462 RepID=A0AAW1QDX6_9CHLO
MEETQDFADTPYNTVDEAVPSGQSDAGLMKQMLINEKAAPEILTYQADLVARLEELIENQDQRIQDNDSPDAELIRSLYLQELLRVKYLLRSYLRTRIQKIEQYVMHILDDPEYQERLSPKELEYAKEFFVTSGQHLKEKVLQHMPPGFDKLLKQSATSEGNDTIPMPDLDRHVFCHVLEDRGTVELEETGTETAEFNKDDLYVVRYRPIRDLVQDGWVRLI